MAHDPDADLVEHVGRDKSGDRADPPKSKRPATAPAPTSTTDPVIYTKPAEGETHPREARLSVAVSLAEAIDALNAATVEVMASRSALQSAQHDEALSETQFWALVERPSPDQLLRDHAAASLAARADRVAAGQSADAKPAPTHGRSPVDVAAAQRPRTSATMPTGGPLRSNVVRR